MSIIEINQNRLDNLFCQYNPYLGVGLVQECFAIDIDSKTQLNIPVTIVKEKLIKDIIKQGSIIKYCRSKKIQKKDCISDVIQLKLKYDFEFWCATCVRVQDKQTKDIVPFILRFPQRKLIKVLIKQLHEQHPIRIILLKARQWGGSTAIQIFMAWIQLFHKKRWHSAIVADVEDQARNIKSMYTRLSQNHPSDVMDFEFSNFEGSTKNKIITSRECIIHIASMQNPDALRSADIMMAHLSEVGLWKETEGKKPEDLVQSIAGTIPTVPYSIIVMESTAKGVGNYFHRQWQRAVNKENGYTPVFVPWYEIEMYIKMFDSPNDKNEFINSMTPKEQEYFELGATLEGINWYREKKYLEGYDDWRMCCEFPTTSTEAFQSTGRRAHSPTYISQMRSFCKEPIFKGEMTASTNYGKGSIDDSLSFELSPNGSLWMWAKPDVAQKVKRRYVVSMDIGGRHEKADWTVISVIDRYWLAQSGVEECVATYRFHLDQDLAVWKAVQLAKYYNNALLVVEANSLNTRDSEGDHSLTILDEIKHFYSNLYCRTDPQKIIEGYPERYGFFTSQSSKTDLINQMNKRFREQGYIERDGRALDEADTYEIKDNGSFGAVDGANDDIYMSRAIGLKASQVIELPYIISE